MYSYWLKDKNSTLLTNPDRPVAVKTFLVVLLLVPSLEFFFNELCLFHIVLKNKTTVHGLDPQ